MYTIVCSNGHEREDARPRGICTICGLSMALKPKPKRVVIKPEEETDG